ncbi:glycosyltransferase family A protein [Thiocystis violascens]|uniref:Glycosyl transferase family 2 n=1 Tax=Thiocystis violascens (strain ATCC 17096 / DSM 198 / 6111) TaxID=765911 RepID=I3YFW0_THIV6|nr:glycosyltransferase family A protein [Thiocystis violascens]AFL75878.1 hypothetical protein Thivi_4054 [Thiocystis violascens DSM 198]
MFPSVSFTVNTCMTDVPFLEQTLRHVFRSLDFPFSERLIAYDPGNPMGKYDSRRRGDSAEILAIFDRLLADGLIDRVDTVPWSEEHQADVLMRYFDRDDIALKDFDGAPIYQYLYALDRCTGDYIFHMDSDMLFHTTPGISWLAQAIEMLRREPRVVFATCRGGPPQARNLLERFLKRPIGGKPPSFWFKAETFSTRYFLMDRARFQSKLLPILQAKSAEPLENSITHTLKLRGLERWTTTGLESWSIHPWRHDDNYLTYLDDLIWAVENGVYPFVRTGYRWDMRTENEHIKEWLDAIAGAGRINSR